MYSEYGVMGILCGVRVHTAERNWSDLSRDSASVADAAERHGAVHLHRRDAPGMYLVPESRYEEASEALTLISRILRNLSRDFAKEAVLDISPWAAFLPPDDLDTYLTELTATLAGAADLGSIEPLIVLQREWKATAEIWADPELAERLQNAPFEPDAAKPVPAPR